MHIPRYKQLSFADERRSEARFLPSRSPSLHAVSSARTYWSNTSPCLRMKFGAHCQQKVKILPRVAGKSEELKEIQFALLCVFLLSKKLRSITFQHPFVCWTNTFLATEYLGKDFLQIELNSYWHSLRFSYFYGTRNFITMFTGTDSVWVWQIQSTLLHSILLLAILDIT